MVQPATQRYRENLAERVASVPLESLERFCVVLLLLAALMPRLRDIATEFDRGIDGDQGATFAIAAVNYERGDAAGAYPVFDIDRAAAPEQRLVSAEHTPLIPLIAWNSVRLLGPTDWNRAWLDGEAPRDIELPLRLPFFAAQMLALVLLWKVAREAYGTTVGLLALAFGAASSVGIQFAGLVGHRNPGIATALLFVLFSMRWMRHERRVDLALSGAAAALSAAVSFGAVTFLPVLVWVGWRKRGARAAWRFVIVGAVCAALPLLLHEYAAHTALAGTRIGSNTGTFDALRGTIAPQHSGSLGLGASAAWHAQRVVDAHGIVIVGAALIGLAVTVMRSRFASAASRTSAGPADSTSRFPLLGVLCCGALFSQIADAATTGDAALSLQLWWLPAISVGAAITVQQLSGPLLRLRAGISPLVVLTLGLALPGLGLQAEWRQRTRGADEPLPMPSATGAWIGESTQAGDFVQCDRSIGLNAAVDYYAWRTICRSDAPNDADAVRIATELGFADRGRLWLSPSPEAPFAGFVAVPATLANRQSIRRDADWVLWRLERSVTEDF